MNKTSNNSKSGIRPLESLNVIDSFLFQEITEDEENAKFIAKLIVKRVTGVELTDITVEVEKNLNGIGTYRRGIRLDLRVIEKIQKELRKSTILNQMPIRTMNFLIVVDTITP